MPARRSIPRGFSLSGSRSIRELECQVRELANTGKRRYVADGMAFGLELVPYGSGMANTPQQSAPNVATTPLRGRLHRAVPGQATGDLWASHE